MLSKKYTYACHLHRARCHRRSSLTPGRYTRRFLTKKQSYAVECTPKDVDEETADINAEIEKLVKPEPRDTLTSSLIGQSPSSEPQATATDMPAIQDAVSTRPTTIKQEEGKDHKPGCQTLWTSPMQLTTCRANASRIADDYLKDRRVKLNSSKARFSGVRDYSAYLQGTRDSKKIDVRRTKIDVRRTKIDVRRTKIEG